MNSFEAALRIQDAATAGRRGCRCAARHTRRVTTGRIGQEQLIDALEDDPQCRGIRQGRDPEMIAVGNVEAYPGRHQYVFLLQQVQRKLLVIEIR